MVRMAWRPPILLLIALTLGLNVGLQDCEVNLLQGDIAFLEILQELSTDSAIPVCGLGTIPLLVQVNIELCEPHRMGQGLWGHDDTSCKKSSEVLTPPHKLWEGKRARHQEGHMFHLPPSHNVVVKINLLACREKVGVHLFTAQTLFVVGSSRDDRRRAPPLYRDGDREALCR